MILGKIPTYWVKLKNYKVLNFVEKIKKFCRY